MPSGTRAKAGRKPKADKDKMMTTVAVRLPNDLYKALKKKSGGKGISEEMRKYLKRGIAEDNRELKIYHTESAQALGMLIGKLAGNIETFTKTTWSTDRYTLEAVRAGIELMLCHLSPEGEVTTPKIWQTQIDDAQKRIASESDPRLKKLVQANLDTMLNPYEYGCANARGIITQLSYEYPPADRPSNEYYAEEFYQFPKIREKLGLKRKG